MQKTNINRVNNTEKLPKGLYLKGRTFVLPQNKVLPYFSFLMNAKGKGDLTPHISSI